MTTKLENDFRLLSTLATQATDIRLSEPRCEGGVYHDGTCYHVYCKSINEWLTEFADAFKKYCKSVFEDPKFDVHISRHDFSITGHNSDGLVDAIYLSFKLSSYTYYDEFNERLIDTTSLVSFMNQLNDLHPGINIPEFREIVNS